jgi:hypothetical protein
MSPNEASPCSPGGDQPSGPNLWQRLWDRWRNGGQNVNLWKDLKERGYNIDYEQLFKYRQYGNIAAENAPITRTQFDQVQIRYGSRSNPKVRADGSVQAGTHTTPVEGLTPTQVEDGLVTRQKVEGFWRIKIPKGTRAKDGITQRQPTQPDARGGLPETIVMDELPPGSAEWIPLGN